MAETVSSLTPTDLARIVHDLDELIMPAPETIRALVAETRRAWDAREYHAAVAARHARALVRIGSIVEHAGGTQ